MPDPGHLHGVAGPTAGAVGLARRELAASLALARLDSPVRGPIQAHLRDIDAELAGRAGKSELAR